MLIRKLISVTLLLACALAGGGAAGALEADKMVEITAIGDMFGPSHLYLSNVGIRLESKIGLLIWNVKAPKVAYMINPENHTYYVATDVEYVDFLHEDYKPIKYEKLETKPIKADYVTNATQTIVLNLVPVSGQYVPVAELIATRDWKLPPIVENYWCALTYSKPEFGGAPIGLKSTNYNAKRRHSGERGRRRVKTLMEATAIKKLPLDKKMFELPKGLRRAKDKTSLYLSEDGNIKQSDLDDFFQTK